MPNLPVNIPAIQALWPTVKAALATVQADLNQVAADDAILEGYLDQLYNYGATDLVDWVRTKKVQTRLGFQQRISAEGNVAPYALAVGAADPTHARDTTAVDLRPVTSTNMGQMAGLS